MSEVKMETSDELRARIEVLERLCAEAYQVIGVLAQDCGRFDTDAVDAVLDNLSQMKLVHEDVLPFESGPAR